MKKFRINYELTKEGRRLVAGAAAALAAAALLLFLLLFRVTRVDVIGNTRYTDQEIQDFVMKSPLTHHTLLVSAFKKHIDTEEIPFVESFDLETLNRHTIRIHVNEKQIVGYIVQGTDKLYFDKDGVVVELTAMNQEEITQMESEAQQLEELRAEAEHQEALRRANEAEEALTGHVTEEEPPEGTESGDEEGENGENSGSEDPDAIQVLQAEEVNIGNEEATEFHAAVTDVPRVIGLAAYEIELDHKMQVKDDHIFNTILGIARIVEKYQILPEMLIFDEDQQITLVYQDGNIHCKLGKDTLLEEKMTRVAAILPDLEGMTGILHLEDYTTDTVNIIFSKESLYTLKAWIAETEQREQELIQLQKMSAAQGDKEEKESQQEETLEKDTQKQDTGEEDTKNKDSQSDENGKEDSPSSSEAPENNTQSGSDQFPREPGNDSQTGSGVTPPGIAENPQTSGGNSQEERLAGSDDLLSGGN